MVEAAQDAGEVDGEVVVAEAGGDSELVVMPGPGRVLRAIMDYFPGWGRP